MVTWVTWMRGLRRCVGCVGQIFTRELRVDYVGENILYVGQHFTWVINFTWVAWVKYIFAWVKFYCVGLCVAQNVLRGSKIFANLG